LKEPAAGGAVVIELLFTVVLSGFFASVSPCSLPVYPVLINSLSRAGEGRRIVVLSFTAGIVLAFSLFYVLVTLAVRVAGEWFINLMDSITLLLYALAGVLCYMFAMRSLGFLGINMGSYSLFKPVARSGVAGAFITGVVFSTLISPCSLPFLITGVLPVLMSGATVFQGLFLMAVFSVSMGAPILLLGLASGWAMDSISFFRNRMRFVEGASAVFLLAAGVYFTYLVFT
jgi:cytochrome c-type biogenesis protein